MIATYRQIIGATVNITSVYNTSVITSTNAQYDNGYSICHEHSRSIIT